jgi:predicted ATPase
MGKHMDRFVTISGCSGGGKSTLLAELARRGHAVVEEPGRRIVREELAGAGAALPWVDGTAFARRAIAMALDDLAKAAELPGLVFFDRGLVDATAALEFLTGEPAIATTARLHPTNRKVFLAPPWPELFAADPERRHGFHDAVAEYERLTDSYRGLGYEPVVLPKVSVAGRAEFVLAQPGISAA